METICRWDPNIYERDTDFIVADCFVFCSFSVYFTEVEKTNVSENSCWNCIHLYRTGAISHRSKYRIYPAGNYLGQLIAALPYRWIIIQYWHDYGIFYC